MSVQHLTGAGLITLAVMLGAIAFLWLRDTRRTGHARTEVWQASAAEADEWEPGVFSNLPGWDGDTYWMEDSPLAQSVDAFEEKYPTKPLPVTFDYPPVPASQVSGEFRTVQPTSDAGEFVASMIAETDAALSWMNAPLP